MRLAAILVLVAAGSTAVRAAESFPAYRPAPSLVEPARFSASEPRPIVFAEPVICCGETVCTDVNAAAFSAPNGSRLPGSELEPDGEFRCFVFVDGFNAGDATRWEVAP